MHASRILLFLSTAALLQPPASAAIDLGVLAGIVAKMTCQGGSYLGPCKMSAQTRPRPCPALPGTARTQRYVSPRKGRATPRRCAALVLPARLPAASSLPLRVSPYSYHFPAALPCLPGVPETCCKYATDTLATYKLIIGGLNSGLIGCTYIDQAPNYCAGGGLDYAKVSARVNGHTFVLTRSDPLADAPLRWSPGRRPVWSDVCEQAAVRAV